jgi:hypothetical protein
MHLLDLLHARCLDPGTIESLEVRPFNGREWEKQFPEGKSPGFGGQARP